MPEAANADGGQIVGYERIAFQALHRGDVVERGLAVGGKASPRAPVSPSLSRPSPLRTWARDLHTTGLAELVSSRAANCHP